MHMIVGVLLISLVVGEAGLDFSAIDDLIDSFLKISGISKDALFTADLPELIKLDVTFWCCNSNTKTLRQTSIDDPFIQSTLDLSLPVIFLIHGWIESVERKWVQDSLRDLCQYRLTNACGVDWRRLAMFIYSMSAKHTIKVGKRVATFIEYLMTEGVSIESIILVGFDLGAHIAGIAGSKLGGRVPLIIGLDPAGPLKTYPILKPVAERLDATDAKFVQAIYTCILYLGSEIPVATQNFYPTGGIAPQPWCTEFDYNIPNPESIACSHFVAVELFRRTINNQIVIESTQCTGIFAFSEGNCRDWQRDRMGLDSKRIPGKFYLQFDTPALAIQDFTFRPFDRR